MYFYFKEEPYIKYFWFVFQPGEDDGRDQSKLETKVWEAFNPLVDKQIDQFLVVAR